LWERFEMSRFYQGFAVVAIASAIFALVRLLLGHDAQEAVLPNIVIGGICLVIMILLSYKEREQIERRN